jgi:penicillin amidase
VAAAFLPARPQTSSVQLEGLRQPVEIIKDRWGISHIYAQNEPDLFFAQGYNAARDRLFQLELWRRQATGTTAELLGSRELRRDIGTRLHKFRGDLEQELNHYHPRGEEIVNAFVKGINAYVLETERHPELLPLEFRLLGFKPGLWSAEVVISRHQGLLGNVTSELRYGQAVALLGAEKVKELSWFRPGDPLLTLDPAIDGSLLSNDILEIYRAFRGSIRFRPEDVVPEYRTKDGAFEVLARSVPDEFELSKDQGAIGSNNWVVGGRLTLSGYPLMANDPHRSQQAPSLRYWVHLAAPGWNVIGGGEPALPGVSIGHNEFGAWGLTVFGQDSEDLYVYDTNPSNPLQYRYRGIWESMKVLRETIRVKGEAPVTVELKYTRHGPVLYEDLQHHKAYALRAAWMDIGSAPYLASLRMDQAKSWEEFRDACAYSRIPAENMVWADVNKNIGYQAVGVSPIRPNWSGLVPVPGDGRYEWDGYLPIKALPHEWNPQRGYIRTANNFMVPDGYLYLDALHYTWGDEMRAVRIDEILGSGRMHTVADMMMLQHDELSVPARNLVPLLRNLNFDEALLREAREMLLNWDFILDKDSVPAAIYASWERRLTANMRELLVPEEGRGAIGGLNIKRIIDWLYAPDGRFGDDPLRGRDEILVRSLKAAVEDLTKRLGADTSQWRYGQPKYKHALIRHPLSSAVVPELRKKLNVGPAPRGGYGSTVNNTGRGDNQTSGASFRIVVDTSNWDNSVGTSNPGQSGNPDDPHYRDLFELWAEGKYFPIFYSRKKVESVAERKLLLEPSSGGAKAVLRSGTASGRPQPR